MTHKYDEHTLDAMERSVRQAAGDALSARNKLAQALRDVAFYAEVERNAHEVHLRLFNDFPAMEAHPTTSRGGRKRTAPMAPPMVPPVPPAEQGVVPSSQETTRFETLPKPQSPLVPLDPRNPSPEAATYLAQSPAGYTAAQANPSASSDY